LIVAVDGQSGSGKSSVSRTVAAERGLSYLDTGAMYRAITLAVLRAGVDPSDGDAVLQVARQAAVQVGTDPTSPTITLDGGDVRDEIRSAEVTAQVSAVSAVPGVRALLVGHQRAAVRAASDAGRGIVVEGRDIGTVVLPDAMVKVFLVADAHIRAARRAAQDQERLGAGGAVEQAQVQSALERRDEADSSRTVSPLRQAADAVTINASERTLDEVVAEVLSLVDAATAAPAR
jgi:cytidylate kinase